MLAIGLRARTIAYILGFLALAAARPAAAETLQLQWDPSPSTNVAGYIVYVRVPGAQANSFDVGNATSFDWSAADGQQDHFSVAAYAAGNVVGAHTAEISRYSNQAPTLTNPGSRTTISGASTSLQLTGSDPEGGGLIYGATNLPPGLSAGSNGAISGTPSTPGAFVVSATVTDGQLTDTETFTWTITPAAQPQDVTAPAVVISVPNAGNTPTVVVQNPAPSAPGNTGSSPVATGPAQSGPATPPDTVPTVVIPPASQPVAATAVLPAPARAPAASGNRFGRWRDAQRSAPAPTPAPAPSTERSVLSRGPRVPAPAPTPDDASTRTTIAERTRAAVQGGSNTPATSTVPTQAVTPLTVSATTQAARNTSFGRAKLTTTVTDQPVITLAGSAADDHGISRVDWVTDRGQKGTATGTDTWIAAVPLSRGLNKITVTVRDGLGNASSTVVAVQYNEGATLTR